MAPKIALVLIPRICECFAYGKGILQMRVAKGARMRRLSWIIQRTPMQSQGDPYKQSQREHRTDDNGDGGGAASQGMPAGSRRLKRQGNKLSSRTSRENQPFQQLDFGPVRLISNFLTSQELKSATCVILSYWFVGYLSQHNKKTNAVKPAGDASPDERSEQQQEN